MQVQGIKSNTNFEAKRRNNIEDIETLARKLLADGYSRKDALAMLVRDSGRNRNQIYKLLMELD